MLLVDVDAAVKLAHWGLLVELPALLDTPLSDCATLSSLRFRAQRAAEKPDGKLFHTAAAAHAVLHALSQMAQLPVDVDLLPALQNLSGIDSGEAVLISAMAARPEVRLLTGDKRCLRALAACSPELREPLAKRVLIVEQILLFGLNAHSLDWLRAKVCALRHIDKAVAIVMGSKCDLSESAVREGLRAYIDEMIGLCDPRLLVC
jgi:hypothetical protein